MYINTHLVLSDSLQQEDVCGIDSIQTTMPMFTDNSIREESIHCWCWSFMEFCTENRSIWVGIQEGIQNTLVLRNGPEVYLQLKCSTKNCQVGFKIRRKHNYTETNQWEKINKLQTNAIYLLELFFVLRPRVIINSRRWWSKPPVTILQVSRHLAVAETIINYFAHQLIV